MVLGHDQMNHDVEAEYPEHVHRDDLAVELAIQLAAGLRRAARIVNEFLIASTMPPAIRFFRSFTGRREGGDERPAGQSRFWRTDSNSAFAIAVGIS